MSAPVSLDHLPEAPSPYTHNEVIVYLVTSGQLAVFTSFILAVLMIVFFPRIRRHKPLLIASIILAVPLILSILPFVRMIATFHPPATALGLVAAALIVLLRRKFRIPRALAAGGGVTVIVFVLLFFFSKVRMGRTLACDRVQSDPAVRMVFSFCEPAWRDKILTHTPPPYNLSIRPHPRTIFPSSDRSAVYAGIGVQDERYPQPFMKIDRGSGDLIKVDYLYSPFRGECLRLPARCFLVSPMKRGMLVIDDARNEMEAEIRFVTEEPVFLAVDHDKKRVFLVPQPDADTFTTSPEIVFEPIASRVIGPPEAKPLDKRPLGPRPSTAALLLRGLLAIPNAVLMPVLPLGARSQGSIWEVDAATLSLARYPQKVFPGHLGSLLYDAPSGTLVALPGIPVPSLFIAPSAKNSDAFLASADGSGDRPSMVAPSPGLEFTPVSMGGPSNFLLSAGFGTGLASGGLPGEVYASYMLEGAVYVYDLTAMKYKEKFRVEQGIRELAIDPNRRLLFVGGFASGRVHVVDLATRETIARVFVGREIRHLSYVQEWDSLLVTSANGFMEVDVRKALEPSRRSPDE